MGLGGQSAAVLGVNFIYKVFQINKKVQVLLLGTVCIGVIAGTCVRLAAQATQVVQEDPYPEMYVETNHDFIDMKSKTVYLTFDDGPSKNTPKILDVLKENDVKATFFVIGKEDEESVSTLKRIVDEGHTIGIHTYTHVYKKIYRSMDSYLEDFNKIDEFIRDRTGVNPKIFRFPGGSANSICPSKSVRKAIVSELTRRGYVYYDWNVVSGDDKSTVTPVDTLVHNMLKGAKGKDSVVILCHDAPLCKTTPEAVNRVIQELKKQGYRFERLTEEVKPIQFYSICQN